MRIEAPTKDDVRYSLQLVRALQLAKFSDLHAKDLAALTLTIQWAAELAKLVAAAAQPPVDKPLIPKAPKADLIPKVKAPKAKAKRK